jgi:hypothetical protein
MLSLGGYVSNIVEKILSEIENGTFEVKSSDNDSLICRFALPNIPCFPEDGTTGIFMNQHQVYALNFPVL